MYNFLVSATKNRVILELREALAKHPIYKNLEIYNRFPYNERIQEGIIVRNSSAGRIALSADNYQGTVFSYVACAHHKNNPGTSLEWVREDESHLCTWMYKQDYSGRITRTSPTGDVPASEYPQDPNPRQHHNDPTQQYHNVPPPHFDYPYQERYTLHHLPTLVSKITLFEHMLKGGKDLSYANSPNDVEVYINNSRVFPIHVDGFKKEIIVPHQPVLNPKVEVSYWVRNLAAPGVYQIEITSGQPEIGNFHFMVDCLLDKKEVLTYKASGTETSFRVSSYPVYKNSLRLRENKKIMIEGKDYFFDEDTGIITLTSSPSDLGPVTVLRNSKIEAEYRFKGHSTGPFEIQKWNCANNTAIPGVVLAFGRGIAVGDKHYVVVQSERFQSAQEYAGKWDMTISLDVYAKDTQKIEEVIDIVTSYLNTYRKDALDGEGIALVNVSFGGEAEQALDEGNNDQFYMGSVDYTFLTEWAMHKPLLQTVEGFTTSVDFSKPDISVREYFPNKNSNFERIK